MGGLSLMVRKFERDAPRPFDRLIVEALPELPDLAGRPQELLQRMQAAHANLEVGELQRDALVELAFLYHANGFSVQAESCYLGLESFEVENPLWPYLLGVLKEDRRDKSEVAEHFARAVQLDPTNSLAYLRLGDAYREGGRFDEARTVYSYRLLGAPGDGWAMARLGQVAMAREEWELAREWLEKARAAMPRLALVYELLPEVLLELGDRESVRELRASGEALDLVYRIEDKQLDFLAAYCYDPDRLLDFARKARAEGDAKGALDLLERAVKLGLGHDEGLAEMNELVEQLAKEL